MATRDRPWLIRTYSGHSSARASNDLYRGNLAKGQTGLSVAYAGRNVPKWNPTNVCPYHLQEAGATPMQELAYGLANAIAVLDAVRESGQVPDDEFPEVFGRISFFIDAGVRFVEEMCKMRAFTQMWDRIFAERYGVTDPKLRRFRYGM